MPCSVPQVVNRGSVCPVTRRLDIELTSRRDDGSWTWRAAGARRPKGDMNGTLVPATASVGDILRVEADAHLDGLDIVAVFEPKPERPEPDRLELLGREVGALVTTRLASKKGRRRLESDTSGDGEGDDRPGRKRRSDKPRRARGDEGGPDGDRRTRDGKGDRRKDRDGGKDRDDRDGRRRDGDGRGDRDRRRDGDGRKDRDGGKSRDRKSASDRDRPRRRDRPERDRADRPAPPRPKRLKPKRIHRRAALDALPADQRPLAEEVLRGGVPGVRRAIGRMNEKARAEGLPPIKADPLIALAERMAPRLKAAEWRDRADAAWAGIDEIDLRDIRSVIGAADRAARTEETRALAENLRTGLAARVEAEHRQWLDELAATMADGRTVRALRLSSRPPKAGSPLPLDMAERLARSASESLGPEESQARWAAVVDAVAFSPVRTQVSPTGVPERPGEPLLAAIRKVADRVPQIAGLFGIEPEPPARRRSPRKPPSSDPAEGDQADQAAMSSAELAESDQAAPSADLAEGSQAAPPAEPAESDQAAPPAEPVGGDQAGQVAAPSAEPAEAEGGVTAEVTRSSG